MNYLLISLLVFALIFGGALVGMVVRPLLSEQHLHPDSRDVVKMATGLIGTLTALVLGLLIASAKSSFDQKTNQVRQMTASIILMDDLLAQYGPEAAPIRKLLRQSIQPLANRIWHEEEIPTGAQIRLQLFTQTGGSIPTPFLIILVFWLSAIFVSFTLFARANLVVMASLFVCALSFASAIFLVLELDNPFTGLMGIPSTTLRSALLPLNP